MEPNDQQMDRFADDSFTWILIARQFFLRFQTQGITHAAK